METEITIGWKRWMWLAVILLVVEGCSGTPMHDDAIPSSATKRTPKNTDSVRKDHEAMDAPDGTIQPRATASVAGKQSVKVPTGSAASGRRERSVIPPDYRKQVAQPSRHGTGEGADAGGDALVEFNFDNASLNEVIRTIAQLLDLKYISDPDVQGTVTIHTAKGVPKKDLFQLFSRILEVNGLVAVKEGEFYRITQAGKAGSLAVPLRLSTDGRPLPQRSDIITQIIPLRHTSATEMAKLLQPFVSANATVVAHSESNTLLVVDNGINIMKVLRLVDAFDLNLLTRNNHRFFFLQHADVDAVVDVLRQIYNSTATGKQDMGRLIPIKRLNAFMAITTSDQLFEQIEELLINLDAPSQGIEPRLYVYSVRNGAATNLSELLNQVFTRSRPDGALSRDKIKSPTYRLPSDNIRNPFTRQVSAAGAVKEPGQAKPEATQVSPSRAAQQSGGATFLKGAIKITPDEIRNALIIEATPADYTVVQQILSRIDVLPRQVLIEATIAEIDHNLTTELGVDWSYTKGVEVSNGILNATLDGTGGLSLSVGVGQDVRATLKALERRNKVNILSSPHVLASDNQRARIDVSNEIPLVSSETVVTSGNDPLVTTNIQYRDTGVMLSVTPHINERALVTMDIYQEVSEQSDDVTVAGQAYPSFFKRTVETSLTVRDGQTIVLGGLIRENKTKSNSGLPLLSRIPLIGALFGQTKDAFDKTELIILLTPRVIVDLNDVDEVTNEFKSKVFSVVQNLRGASSTQ